MTIFSGALPYELMPAIFDMFIVEGWKSVFRVGIALLKQLESQILTRDMMECCEFLREDVRHKLLFEPK